jgi:D-3-phosphoglycerate dehydrogenase / 2-oxoglutarate reductase
MQKENIAITIRSFDRDGPAMEKLRSHFAVTYMNDTGGRLTEDDLSRALRGADGAIAGTEPFTRRVLDAAGDLKVISRVGVGLDSVDLEAAASHGIGVTITPSAPVQAVAEHTLALLLSVAKQIPVCQARLREGDAVPPPGLLVSGRTAGIVGMGRIGKRVAGLLEALGCRISYYDPGVDAGRAAWVRKERLEDLARGADILTLHAPAQPGNRPLIGREIISLCRRGLILVNTARGSLIDEEALAYALEEGIVAGAGLDVFSREPYRGPLLRFPQVVATPHVASNTVETRRQMEMEAVDNMIEALAGRTP